MDRDPIFFFFIVATSTLFQPVLEKIDISVFPRLNSHFSEGLGDCIFLNRGHAVLTVWYPCLIRETKVLCRGKNPKPSDSDIRKSVNGLNWFELVLPSEVHPKAEELTPVIGVRSQWRMIRLRYPSGTGILAAGLREFQKNERDYPPSWTRTKFVCLFTEDSWRISEIESN